MTFPFCGLEPGELMPGIRLDWTGGAAAISIQMDKFRGDQFPRSFVETAPVIFATSGSQVQSGETRGHRHLWTISTVLDRETAFDLEDLYADWDTVRATGAVAVVQITDNTFRRKAAGPIVTNAVFTTPTLFTPGAGADYAWCDFAMLEVY